MAKVLFGHVVFKMCVICLSGDRQLDGNWESGGVADGSDLGPISLSVVWRTMGWMGTWAEYVEREVAEAQEPGFSFQQAADGSRLGAGGWNLPCASFCPWPEAFCASDPREPFHSSGPLISRGLSECLIYQ